MAECRGVDGCRAGWIVAEAEDLDATPRLWVAPTFRELLPRAGAGPRVTCIDVPIGLADGARACDGEARRLLGGRRACSVFTPPCRAALAGRSPAERRALNLRDTGRSLSAQALGILDKIREVDGVITPALQRRVREVHPELVFAAAAGGGLVDGKKTERGRAARLALLPPAFARAAPTRERRPWPAGEVALDDCVDALAALVAALRIARGEGRRLPAGRAEGDARGLAMEIWY